MNTPVKVTGTIGEQYYSGSVLKYFAVDLTLTPAADAADDGEDVEAIEMVEKALERVGALAKERAYLCDFDALRECTHDLDIIRAALAKRRG